MCPPLDSAGHEGVQPAAQLRHVQGHSHGVHVLRALRACPGPCAALSRALPVHADCGRRHPTPSRLPGRTCSRIACPPFHTAGSDGVQPAADLRHLQRHGHALHVQRALLPVTFSNLQSSLTLLHAACAAFVRRLPGRSTSPRSAFPPFDSRQYASAFNQPLTFDTSSVTDMRDMFRVRSPPWPAPNLHSSPPLNAACPVVARRPPASRAGPQLAPHRMPSFRLGSARRRSTSR